MNQIFEYSISNLIVQTGDILCLGFGTNQSVAPGEFWRILGLIIPGEIDHVAIFIGPDGRCVEASARGVYAFNLVDNKWSPEMMYKQRGCFKDALVGAVYPLQGLNLSTNEETRIRIGVAHYCLEQVKMRKPYNINLLDPDREDAFYCSQLAYKAYLPYGINLNSNQGVDGLPGSNNIVFPHEIWSSNPRQRILY